MKLPMPQRDGEVDSASLVFFSFLPDIGDRKLQFASPESIPFPVTIQILREVNISIQFIFHDMDNKYCGTLCLS